MREDWEIYIEGNDGRSYFLDYWTDDLESLRIKMSLLGWFYLSHNTITLKVQFKKDRRITRSDDIQSIDF